MALLNFEYGELLVKILLGFVVALACGPLALWIAGRFHLQDIPGRSAHKLHHRPTPLAGGIILASSLVILLPILGLWQKPISAVLISGSIIFLFGLLDDAKGLSAPQKFIGQFLASIVLIASDYSVHFLSNMDISFLSPNTVAILDWVITIFWFVGITNAFNLIDSMDGLAVGAAGIGFATFMIMAFNSHQELVASSSAMLVGICIGIFIYNRNPARLFLGDAGALSLGFILAAVAMIYTPLDVVPQSSSWFVPIIVLGYPIFDTTLVVISRLRRRQSIFKADHAHTYHRLVAFGVKSDRAVLLIQIISLLFGFFGISTLSQSPIISSIIFGTLICIGLAFIIYLEIIHPISKFDETKSNEQWIERHETTDNVR